VSNGRVWPYAIGIAITLVFGFCVATIVVTSKANIQESNAYMTHYQDADMNANEYIKAKIDFDKKYKIEYITQSIAGENPVVKYKVTDIEGKPVDNAELVIAVSRPETSEFDQELSKPEVKDGVYTFRDVKFPKAGAWDIIAKVTIGDDYRFYNIKADTRNPRAYEF